MSSHEIKRNDTRPYWPVTLTFDDGTVPDLTGGSVRFIAEHRQDPDAVIDVAAVITDGPNGQCEWRPLAADTDVEGVYRAEWEATLADGTIQTFPTRGYDRLKIVEDLA